MIQSMTGYGKSVVQLPTKKITVEIKSLNSKNLDLGIRIPSHYKEKELAIRKKLAKNLVRGKIDFSIYMETTAHNPLSTIINKAVIKTYMTQLKEVVSVADQTELLKMAIRMPEALTVKKEDLNQQEWEDITTHIDDAIEEIIRYRTDEAASLTTDFKCRITQIKTHLETVKSLDEQRIEHIKIRLQKAINELDATVDKNRFEQELIYYLEKLAIDEETVRLETHLDYFLKELDSPTSNGKKLGFITQEMGREINTIGSKSNFASMQKAVVQMKDELEKIKEQILNVL